MKNILDKKDFAYWILILVLIIVGLSTSKCAENDTILNYISFAGTITSILLALIAIIYSFVQNFTNVTLNQKLIDSADKIETATQKVNSSLFGIENAATKLEDVSTSVINATSNIDNSSENIKKVSTKIDETMEGLLKSSDELFLKFECVTSEIQQTLNERLESTHSEISNVSKQISELRELTQKNPDNRDASNDSNQEIDNKFIDNYVSWSSLLGKITLYFLGKLYHSNIRKIEIRKALKFMFDNNDEYAYGYFIASSCAGLFDYTSDDSTDEPTINMLEFNDELFSKLKLYISEKKNLKLKKPFIKKIDQYIKLMSSDKQ